MNAKELRIGNWVQRPHYKKPYQVNKSSFIGMKIAFYTPIELTEEWIVKFGYESIQEMVCDFDELFQEYQGIKVEYYNDTGILFFLNMKIHELQNFWKINTGKDL